jgi:hypothetical protein
MKYKLPFNFGKLKIKYHRAYNTQLITVRTCILLSKLYSKQKGVKEERRKKERNKHRKKECVGRMVLKK